MPRDFSDHRRRKAALLKALGLEGDGMQDTLPREIRTILIAGTNVDEQGARQAALEGMNYETIAFHSLDNIIGSLDGGVARPDLLIINSLVSTETHSVDRAEDFIRDWLAHPIYRSIPVVVAIPLDVDYMDREIPGFRANRAGISGSMDVISHKDSADRAALERVIDKARMWDPNGDGIREIQTIFTAGGDRDEQSALQEAIRRRGIGVGTYKSFGDILNDVGLDSTVMPDLLIIDHTIADDQRSEVDAAETFMEVWRRFPKTRSIPVVVAIDTGPIINAHRALWIEEHGAMAVIRRKDGTDEGVLSGLIKKAETWQPSGDGLDVQAPQIANILLAGGMPDPREILLTDVQDAGYNATRYGSLEKALDKINKDRPDLVLFEIDSSVSAGDLTPEQFIGELNRLKIPFVVIDYLSWTDRGALKSVPPQAVTSADSIRTLVAEVEQLLSKGDGVVVLFGKPITTDEEKADILDLIETVAGSVSAEALRDLYAAERPDADFEAERMDMVFTPLMPEKIRPAQTFFPCRRWMT